MNLTGQILISLPNIQDQRFYKSVIYICAHTAEGAMGIIINKSLEIDLYPNLLKELGIDNQPLMQGLLCFQRFKILLFFIFYFTL